ncbi:MAG: hypothetical protein ACI9QQ_002377, partial [Myxococcota bacterium]
PVVLGGRGNIHAVRPVSEEATGEIWFIESRSLFGINGAQDIYYCPPSSGGHRVCKEARMLGTTLWFPDNN